MKRRHFVKAAAGTAALTSLPFSKFEAVAQAENEEHFFIFVELRGGVHWILATDGRDPSKLPRDPSDPTKYSDRVVPFEVTETLPTVDEYQLLSKRLSSFDPESGAILATRLLYPYVGSMEDSSSTFTTNLGLEGCLGFAAREELAPFVNDIGVFRGVYMQGGFHNNTPEMFTGAEDGGVGSWSSFIAHGLKEKLGVKLLDNIGLENPYYTGAKADGALPLVGMTGEALNALGQSSAYEELKQWDMKRKYGLVSGISSAAANVWQHSEQRRDLMKLYSGEVLNAEEQQRLISRLDIPEGDQSLNLQSQLSTVMSLFKNGLSRVANVCLGASNGRNQVDGFGLFDCHRGLFHLTEGDDSRANSERHHLNVKRAMGDLATFIKTLKETPYNAQKSFFDVTTVVVTSEYARPSNFSGNEASGGEGGTNFGNGHYAPNNNYILFGKGVKKGAWLGSNDIVSQHAKMYDFRYLDPRSGDKFEDGAEPQAPASAAEYEQYASVVKDLQGDPSMEEGEDLKLEGSLRPVMAKDIGRTLFEIAGLSEAYTEKFQRKDLADARILHGIIEK